MRHKFTLYAILLLGLIPAISLVSCVNRPGVVMQWYKTFGSGVDACGYSAQQTTDGGYIVCGRIVYAPSGAKDGAWLIKTDAEGNKLWDKVLGGEEFRSVQETADGGYIVCGGIMIGRTNEDLWLVKTDVDGNELWARTFAPSEKRHWAYGNSVQQTQDGGYIIGGRNSEHLWLIKTDADGNAIWDKIFARNKFAIANSVRQTTDGGYIVCGSTSPQEYPGGPVSRKNVWLIKTDAEGNKLWDRTFGDELYASGDSVQQTTDGGYIICGSGDAEKTVYSIGPLLIKTDAEGNKLWDKVLYRDGNKLLNEMFRINEGSGQSVIQAADGGYIVCGSTYWEDLWLIKTDAEGNKLWEKIFDKEIRGGAGGHSIQKTADGGYIISGFAHSTEAFHVLLLKVSPER
jgi:hypothetical protein